MTSYAEGAPEMEPNPLEEESELTWSPNQVNFTGAHPPGAEIHPAPLWNGLDPPPFFVLGQNFQNGNL